MAIAFPMFRQRQATYRRQPPLVLVNGLAEQTESWYCNLDAWRQHFEVHTPQLLAYDGVPLHRRIAAGAPIDVGYLVERLHHYLEEYAQRPPYHLVANSLGGKVAVEFAVRYPALVDRLVLLCPSGLGEEERLPIVEGVRRSDLQALVTSVFHNPRHADPALLGYYRTQFANRRWRTGLLRTIRGTMGHRVADQLARVTQRTLLVVGGEDRIVNPREAMAAARYLANGTLVVLEDCGHAPQIEQAARINRLVLEFLEAV